MNAPDENSMIASLLEDAARSAAAEKLAEALAITEQARRDAAFNADRQWFKSRPDRSYRARLATQQEVADLHASGAWPRWTLDPACFIWAIVRSRTGTEALYVVLPPPTHEPREDELRHMWGPAVVAIARGTGSEREPGGADRRGKEIVR
jgi:hypothetical protein